LLSWQWPASLLCMDPAASNRASLAHTDNAVSVSQAEAALFGGGLAVSSPGCIALGSRMFAAQRAFYLGCAVETRRAPVTTQHQSRLYPVRADYRRAGKKPGAMETNIRSAHQRGATVVVLPELADSGYVFASAAAPIRRYHRVGSAGSRFRNPEQTPQVCMLSIDSASLKVSGALTPFFNGRSDGG
jgi:hypothetical protein